MARFAVCARNPATVLISIGHGRPFLGRLTDIRIRQWE